MTSNKRSRTTENSRPTNNVAAFSSNNGSSVTAPKAPKNTTEQTKTTQTRSPIVYAVKGMTLSSLSDHVVLLHKQLAMVIKK
jgi:hypothetical protein